MIDDPARTTTDGLMAIRRLCALTPLDPSDRALLGAVLRRHVRHLPARADIIDEGDLPRAVRVIHEGWVCRYKQLPDGRRQILAFLLPGDLCDCAVFLLDRMDHALAAMTPVRFSEIPPADFLHLTREVPDVADALALSELVTVAIQREWTLNLGQRTALERVAHLLCELYARLDAVGLVRDGGFAFPLTQTDVASATGLTPVHVNRTLASLRREGLISLQRRWLLVRNIDRLAEVAMFDPAYLHVRSA